MLDEESVAVEGDLLTLRPFTISAETVHAWSVVGDELTLDFRSTTEGETTSACRARRGSACSTTRSPFTR